MRELPDDPLEDGVKLLGDTPEFREHFVRTESEESETSPLTSDLLSKGPSPRWTVRDKYLVVLNVLLKIGDSIEIYLPGIVTQIIACKIDATETEEGLLGIAFYVSLLISTVITVPISNRLGRRPVLLFSLYISILANILCAAVPENFFFILASRLGVGFCVGLNMSTGSVFMSENVSSKKVYCSGIFLDSFFFAVGSAWVAVLGYFLLGSVGWRIFILFTSLPIFIPSLIILHCKLKEESGRSAGLSIQYQNDGLDFVPNFRSRLLKGSLLNMLNLWQGYGCILLLPALLRLNNERNNGTDGCKSSIQGEDFLIIALLSGAAHIVGRILGLAVSNFRFWLVQAFLALVSIACYGALILNDSYISVVICVGIANVSYSMTRLELKLMECDIQYFGRMKVATASAWCLACGYFGAIIGTCMAEFLTTHEAVIGTFACSCALFLAALFVRDYKNN